MLKEKRAHYRVQLNLSVLYLVSNDQAPAIREAMTCDISDNGISFYTDTFHKKGTSLKVTLPRIFDTPRPCTVIWHSKKYHDIYKIGVYFQQSMS